MRKIFTLLAILFLLNSSFVFAQCCSTGCTMSGTKSFGVNEKDHLSITAFYNHSYSDQYFTEDSRSDFKYLTNSYFDFSSLDISYGVTSKFTVETQMGYYLNKTQNYSFGGYKLVGHGPADLSILLKYNLFISQDSVWSCTFIGGAKLPTGTYKEYTKDDVLLPRDVQSGTGAYAGIAGITILVKPFKSKNISFILNRKETLEGRNPDGYKYGFTTTNSISASFKLFKKCSFLFMLQNENRARDNDNTRVPPDSPTINASGYTKFLAIPALITGLGREWELGAYFNYPFYQKYNGTQFGNKYAVSATLSKTFGLHK